MKDLEKVSEMLKQFMQESLDKTKQLDEELESKRMELNAKYQEIEDVLEQMDYLDMIKGQLEYKLELLEKERMELNAEIDEKEFAMQRNRIEGVVDKFDTDDGEETVFEDEGK